MTARKLFGTLGILLVALGVISSSFLAWSTSTLRENTREIHQALQSVRVAERLELHLLTVFWERRLLEVTKDEAHRTTMQEEIHEVEAALAETRAHVTSGPERLVLAEVERDVGRYLEAVREGLRGDHRRQRLRAALATVNELSSINAEQAEVIQSNAQRVDRLANLSSGVIVVALLTLIAGLIFIFRRQVLRPLEVIRSGIDVYRAGDVTHRIPPPRLAELGAIATELNRMAEAHAARERLQFQFLAGVAHDLRTPLASLKLSAQLLARGGAPAGEDSLPRVARRIDGQVDALHRMIEDLLDRTRIGAGNLTLRREVRDLGGLIEELVDAARALSDRHEVVLTTQSPELLAEIDVVRVSQVVNNLLHNAIKYSPAGGTVHVTLNREGGLGVLDVQDEGVGVAPEDAARIFEPFQRSSRAAEIPGVGLGLAVARRIAEAHGGDLTLLSGSGRGATFRLRLPLADRPAVSPEVTTH